jgi:hypothetical protein
MPLARTHPVITEQADTNHPQQVRSRELPGKTTDADSPTDSSRKSVGLPIRQSRKIIADPRSARRKIELSPVAEFGYW